MTIEFSPKVNNSNISGATAPTTTSPTSAPSAPNQLMALGAPPPDFAGSIEGWIKAIQEMLWPQTQSEGGQSTSDAKDGTESTVGGRSEEAAIQKAAAEEAPTKEEEEEASGKAPAPAPAAARPMVSAASHYYGAPLGILDAIDM